jgi:predicted RNA-binding Zn ribbon-like protein
VSAPPDRIVLSPSGDQTRASPLIAGALCLELCNTISRRYTDAPVERLPDYRALLSWAAATGALDARTAARLTTLAIHEPRSADRVLAAAHELRGAIHAVFLAAVEHEAPQPGAIALLDRHIRRSFAARRLMVGPSRVDWRWTEGDALVRPLWPVALSAAELLTSPDLTRVRECAGRAEGCGWLFLDSSRGSGRRWCTMEVCGNRAKARRHYRRAQQR